MYDVPCESCVQSDHRGLGSGYGYSSPRFGMPGYHGDGDEESKIDHDNVSIQFSIQSNEHQQQEQTQLSDIQEIRRRALLLKQKLHMFHMYDDLLDMDSLYSEPNGAVISTEDNATTMIDSIRKDQHQSNPVNHLSQHSFGSLYSASSSSDSEGVGGKNSSLSQTRSFHGEHATVASPKQFLNEVNEVNHKTEYKFKTNGTKPHISFGSGEEEADVDSMCSVSHGEIEGILEELENEAENGLSLVEKQSRNERRREAVFRHNVPSHVTTPSYLRTKEWDTSSVQSFVHEDSDDEYGFAALASPHDKSCCHEIPPKSKSVVTSKRSIDKRMELNEYSAPLTLTSAQEVVAWGSQKVELFLNEYNSLHQRKESEKAAMGSRMKEYIEKEAKMKKEVEAVIEKNKKEQLELTKTKESLKEAKKNLELQVLDTEYLKKQNAKLKHRNEDLIVAIQNCESDAAEKERSMRSQYENLKESHMKTSQTLEKKLTKFQCLIQDLQDHSRKLQQSQSVKLEEMNEKLCKQKRITKQYKKKYLSACEKCNAMNDELKLQREKIESLEKRMQDQKTFTATLKVADLKKKLRKKKKSKKGVKKTDAV